MAEAQVQGPEIVSPSTSGRRRRRRSNGSSSFEFCVLRKPNLLSADQLFSDGVLLPLHFLQRPSTDDPPKPKQLDSSTAEQPELAPEPKQPDSSRAEQSEVEPEPKQPDSSRAEKPELAPESGPEVSAAVASSSASAFASSKRWRDIFKKSDKKKAKGGENISEKVNKDKKGGGIFGANGVSAAERVLNINIWPFRRSKSAGNGGARPVGSGLSSPKVSSAPCSRSNSPGEFKSKKSPSCPKGRSSLVWPARRNGGTGGRSYGFLMKSADKYPKKDRNYVEKSFKKDGNKGWRKVSPAAADGGAGDWHKARVLTMNASMCTDASGGGGVSGEGVRVNLRNLFTMKEY